MINPYYFTDRVIQVDFIIVLVSHHINHANSKLTITPNFPEFGIEVRFINRIIKQLSIIYARSINQSKFNNETVFSARFDKQDEDSQVLDEIEIFTNLNVNHNLTEGDLDITDINSP